MNTPADPERLNLPSASSFDMDVECPGRQNLLRQLRSDGITEKVDEETAAQRERGQRIHAAWATKNTLPLKDESERRAYLEALALERVILEKWDAKPIRMLVEQRLWLNDPTTLEPLLSGQFDRIYVAETRALVLDLKNGFGHYLPPASRSWQLRIYALLAMQEWGGLECVRAGYLCPERFGVTMEWVDFTAEDLSTIHADVLLRLAVTHDPSAERKAGDHCVFCPAKAHCPEAIAMAAPPALVQRPAVDLAASLPLPALAEAWKRKRAITKVFEAIEARLRGLTDEELAGVGLRRAKGRETHRYDTAPTFNALVVMGAEPSALLTLTTLPKGELVKHVAEWRGVTEADAERWLAENLSQFQHKTTAKASIVEV